MRMTKGLSARYANTGAFSNCLNRKDTTPHTSKDYRLIIWRGYRREMISYLLPTLTGIWISSLVRMAWVRASRSYRSCARDDNTSGCNQVRSASLKASQFSVKINVIALLPTEIKASAHSMINSVGLDSDISVKLILGLLNSPVLIAKQKCKPECSGLKLSYFL